MSLQPALTNTHLCGPLQITSLKNYDFCTSHPACDCPDISKDYEQPAQDATVGFRTASCMWAGVFGYSLSQLVDGTREGFLNTCCTIHQGHYPCNDMEQYQNRKRYWGIANTCLGAIERKEDASADSQVVNTNWADAQGANNGRGVCLSLDAFLHFAFLFRRYSATPVYKVSETAETLQCGAHVSGASAVGCRTTEYVECHPPRQSRCGLR